MRTSLPVLGLFVGLFFSSSASAQQDLPHEDVIDVPAIGEGLCLHNLFQSHMVLQRDRPIRIWGWAEPGEDVHVEFDGEQASTTAKADREWTVTLAARPASAEAKSLRVTGAKGVLELEDILVGDVWLLGGQSNMEFPLERVDNGWLEIVSAHYDQIRILTVPAPQGPQVRKSFPRLFEWSSWFNRHFRKGDWDVCSPKIAVDLSAIGYVFARRIHMAAQIPIGVIDLSRGGTTVETWTPESVLREMDTPEVQALLLDWQQRIDAHAASDKQDPGPAMDHNRPGTCFNNMISPVAGLAVKGAIFHQGYNNANGGSWGVRRYRQVFPEMIRAWRMAFNDPSMPFGIISLCTDGPRQTPANYAEMMINEGIELREAQYQTFLALRAVGDQNIGFASSFDQRRGWYHPQQKIPVGERIARWALATQYGFDRQIRWLPPQITEMKVDGNRIVLHFDRAVAPEDNQAAIEGFAIAGEDRRFQPARAEWLEVGRDARNRPQIDRRALVLTSPHVAAPIHFRYAWGRNPMGNLQSADHNDLPLATQRSDAWPMEEVPLGVLGESGFQGGLLTRPDRNKIRAALRRQDLDRRLAEARALLAEAEGTDSH